MMEVAGVVAGRRSSVTVLMNGGQIAYTDVAASLGSGRPVVVLAGSGRTADAIARARAGNGGDNRAVEIAASPLTTVVDVGEAAIATAAIEAALAGGSTSGWPPSCRPGVGGRLAGRRRTGLSARARRRVPAVREKIRTEWLPVSRNGAAPGSCAASAGRVRWPSG